MVAPVFFPATAFRSHTLAPPFIGSEIIHADEQASKNAKPIFRTVCTRWSEHNPLRVMQYGATVAMHSLVDQTLPLMGVFDPLNDKFESHRPSKQVVDEVRRCVEWSKDNSSDVDSSWAHVAIKAALCFKAIHPVLVTTLYLVPGFQEPLKCKHSNIKMLFTRPVGVQFLKFLRSKPATRKPQLLVLDFLTSVCEIDLSAFESTFGVKLDQLLDHLCSLEPVWRLNWHLQRCPHPLRDLSVDIMFLHSPWTPLLTEYMIALLDVLPPIALKSCSASLPNVDRSQFRAHVTDAGSKLVRETIIPRLAATYDSGASLVDCPEYSDIVSGQQNLVKAMASEACVQFVRTIADDVVNAFFPLLSDPTVAAAIANVAAKPVFELLLETRIPLTIECTLVLLRKALNVLEAGGKAFVPTVLSTDPSKSSYKMYVSFSSNMSARTIVDYLYWSASWALTGAALASTAVISTAAVPVAPALLPVAAGIAVASKANKAADLVVGVTKRATKWYYSEDCFPFRFNWDPLAPLFENEGNVRYYLSNWSESNEVSEAWFGGSTGAAFFGLVAGLATSPATQMLPDKAKAALDAMHVCEDKRASATAQLYTMYTILSEARRICDQLDKLANYIEQRPEEIIAEEQQKMLSEVLTNAAANVEGGETMLPALEKALFDVVTERTGEIGQILQDGGSISDALECVLAGLEDNWELAADLLDTIGIWMLDGVCEVVEVVL